MNKLLQRFLWKRIDLSDEGIDDLKFSLKGFLIVIVLFIIFFIPWVLGLLTIIF